MHVPIVLKYGSLKLLEPSWSDQDCNVMVLPFTKVYTFYRIPKDFYFSGILEMLHKYAKKVFPVGSLTLHPAYCVERSGESRGKRD
jgi:hypothetical protein